MMPHELPTPPQIAQCPELALLSVLDFTLDAAVRALVAAHPELDGAEQPYIGSYQAQYALSILGQIWRLKQYLLRYWERALKECSSELKPQDADNSW